MKAKQLVWMGVPTRHFAETVAFFRDVLGLEAEREEMEAKGVEFLGPVHDGDPGAAWSHFRGPDGKIYEITQIPERELRG